jgi:hypothetical protein
LLPILTLQNACSLHFALTLLHAIFAHQLAEQRQWLITAAAEA